MTISKRPVITDEQQPLLAGVQVRLLAADERERFDQLLLAEHYLQTTQLVGEQVRYVAEYQGQWVGLLAWSAAAYKLKAREQWIGWTPRQKKRRLSLVVNNSRFLVLKAFAVPNLASRILKLCLQRLRQDWQDLYGHAVLLAETFVDSQRFRGTCYKASGWTLLGQTQGYQRAHEDFYQPHDRPKQLWVRELRPGARTVLRGRNLPAALQTVAATQTPECEQTPEQLQQMRAFFAGLTDWRQRTPDYRLSSLITVSVCALLCKVCLGQRDLAAFAANLTVDQMAALRFPRVRGSYHRRYHAPKETMFFRRLSHVQPTELEAALRAELARVVQEGVTEDELARVKAQVVAGQVFKRDSIFGQAMEIAQFETAGLSHRDIDRVLERIKAVSAEQVRAVAKQYFVDDALTVVALEPQPLDQTKPRPAPTGARH